MPQTRFRYLLVFSFYPPATSLVPWSAKNPIFDSRKGPFPLSPLCPILRLGLRLSCGSHSRLMGRSLGNCDFHMAGTAAVAKLGVQKEPIKNLKFATLQSKSQAVAQWERSLTLFEASKNKYDPCWDRMCEEGEMFLPPDRSIMNLTTG